MPNAMVHIDDRPSRVTVWLPAGVGVVLAMGWPGGPEHQPSSARSTATAAISAMAAAEGRRTPPYVPARQAAAKALAKNPEKSDRAIAKDLGITHPTVAKARQEATGNNLPVERRIGRDGRARRPPPKKTPPKPIIVPLLRLPRAHARRFPGPVFQRQPRSDLSLTCD